LVTFIIAATVAPAGNWSMAMTRDCFDSGLALLVVALPAGFWAGFAARAISVDDKSCFLFADADMESSVWFGSRRHRAASPKPHHGQ
jgi:hypothetical protein